MKRICFLLIVCVLAVHSVEAQKRRKSKSNFVNGHEYVDLGLSVKWATCNIGASSPSDFGNYYAWGELQPKEDYLEKNCFTYRKRVFKISGDEKYDAARVHWGGTWRLPTKREIKELIKKCKWELTIQNGKKGYRIIGPNGNYIFLPAGGFRYGSYLYFENEFGFFWGDMTDMNVPENAYCMAFGEYEEPPFRAGWVLRQYGRNIRPVTK